MQIRRHCVADNIANSGLLSLIFLNDVIDNNKGMENIIPCGDPGLKVSASSPVMWRERFTEVVSRGAR
jgi:hypothetical protein